MEEAIAGINKDYHNLKNQLIDTTNKLEDIRNYTEAILETINDLVIVVDNELRIKGATKGFYKKFNTTVSETEGYYFYELKACPWNDECLLEKLTATVKDRSSFSNYEVNCNFPVTGERVFKINARHLESSFEKNLVIITINDITDLRVEKNKLVENEKKLEERIKLAVESAELGTWEMDPNTDKITWDERCQDLFGIKQEVISYESFLEAVHPDDREITDGKVKNATRGFGDGKYNIEYRTRFAKENDMRWLKASGRAYFDDCGKATRFAGTILDITHQKLSDQLLRESEERFRLASDAAAAMIWLSGIDKSCNYFNKSWLHFTGNTFEQEKGSGWTLGIYPEDFDRWKNIYNSHFDARKEFYMEYRLKRHDGQYRWLSDSGVPRFSPEGIFEGFIGTCVDIHDQKMTKEELEKLVDDRTQLLSDAINNLEASNHNLEEFAYVASHDLQEPLRKIQTFADRLEKKNDEGLTGETKLYLSKITKASMRMSRLIGDLLSYSRLQKTDQPVETIDLNEVIANVLIDFDLIIQDKKAAIKFSNLPAIKAAPTGMNQLFHNMISNALKFSKPATPPIIKIYAENLPANIKEKHPSLKKEQTYTMITFEDNGIGFNDESADKIFNIFHRLNGVGEYEGTGIGLAICRKIVINHQGVIFAESQEDVGTSFRVILPVK
ncbi:MAG: PAS domain S-box protein [Ferruginibacter sp.]